MDRWFYKIDCEVSFLYLLIIVAFEICLICDAHRSKLGINNKPEKIIERIWIDQWFYKIDWSEFSVLINNRRFWNLFHVRCTDLNLELDLSFLVESYDVCDIARKQWLTEKLANPTRNSHLSNFIWDKSPVAILNTRQCNCRSHETIFLFFCKITSAHFFVWLWIIYTFLSERVSNANRWHTTHHNKTVARIIDNYYQICTHVCVCVCVYQSCL